MSGYFIDPTSGGTMPNNLELAQKKLNDIRQLVTTVSERPAAKTSGERATFIAYRETTWLKRQLGELAELLKLARGDESQIVGDKDWSNFSRPLGAPKLERPTKTEALVLHRLHDRGSMTTSQLASELNMSPSTALDLLQLLQGLGKVESNNLPEFEGANTSWRLVMSSKPSNVPSHLLTEVEDWMKVLYEGGASGVTPEDVAAQFDVDTVLAFDALRELENKKRIHRLRGEFRTFSYGDA